MLKVAVGHVSQNKIDTCERERERERERVSEKNTNDLSARLFMFSKGNPSKNQFKTQGERENETLYFISHVIVFRRNGIMPNCQPKTELTKQQTNHCLFIIIIILFFSKANGTKRKGEREREIEFVMHQ